MSLREQHNAIYKAWCKSHVDITTPVLNKDATIVPAKDRYRNTWERQFGQELDLRQRIHDIRQVLYEGLKFRLADGAWYTPDFDVWLPDDVLDIYEVKGRKREAAMVRFRVARSMYPGCIWHMVKKECGRWVEMDV